MGKNVLDADILIETLKRSNLKTVLIEGIDDIEVYRRLEEDLDLEDISFLECGGRINLLNVYKRKNELGNQKLLFFCDSDTWVFFGKPHEYQGDDLINTKGYSIENELYSDGEDILIKLLRKNERVKHSQILDSVCAWYTHEIDQLSSNPKHECNFSSLTLLNTTKMKKNAVVFETSFLKSRGFIDPNVDLLNDIRDNFQHKLRGKYLFQIFEKIFQERTKKDVTYTKSQLFDLIISNILTDNLVDKELVKKKEVIQSYF